MLVGAENSEGSEDLSFLVSLGDSSEFISSCGLLTWQDGTRDLVGCTSGGKLLLSGIVNESLLWLVGNSWEENKLGLVSAQSVHIELELLLASVGPSVIYSNTNSSGEAGAQFGSLELLKSKAAAVSNFASIPACL